MAAVIRRLMRRFMAWTANGKLKTTALRRTSKSNSIRQPGGKQGRDPQLERAVEYLMEDLKKNPPKQYKLPAFPNYFKNTTPASAVQGGCGN